MQKRWKILPVDEKQVHALQKDLKINPLLCRLLVQRGIFNYEEAKSFFRPQLTDLHDPFLMKDMDLAVDRLQKAIQGKEKILLYGDYDVDGTTSVALFYSFLEEHHKLLDYYIPDRYEEGYGISIKGIDYAAANGYSLIVAMDCGIKAVDKIAYAASLGIDFIICDHHLPEGQAPAAVAVLDPKQADCNYPYKELSGCGISFKLAEAYLQANKLPLENLYALLDLLVISIACDIVPMTGENRTLAFYGLQHLNRKSRPGLKALLKMSKRSYPLSISDIVFGIGPNINAAGRMAHAHDAVKLLLSSTTTIAEENARSLVQKNMRRREVERKNSEEAIELFQQQENFEKRNTVVLFQKDWHKGVIGIVAARMTERFYRPSIIFTEAKGFLVASARSVRGYDIHHALTQCLDLLENFGGHKYAAGLSIKPENLKAFRERFEKVVSDSIKPEQLQAELQINAEIDLSEISTSFWNILKQFAPFGPENRRPVFLSTGLHDAGYTKLSSSEEHLSISVQQNKSKPYFGMAFGMGDLYPTILKRPFDLCFALEENNWKGKTSLRLNVKDIRLK